MQNRSDLDSVIGKLGEGHAGVAAACEAVEAWARAKRIGDLVALATELEEKSPTTNDEDARIAIELVADHVEDELALTPGDEAVEALLVLLGRDRVRSVRVPRSRELRARAFASRLGYGQDLAALRGALQRAGNKAEHLELLACWLHELALRGGAVAGDADCERFHEERLAKTGHPLGALPLTMLAAESEATTYLPLYGGRGLSNAVARLEAGPMSTKTVPPPADGAAVDVQRVEDAAVSARMIAAVQPWLEASNGKSEVAVFTLSTPVSPHALGGWLLRALPIDSVKSKARFEVARVGAESIFGALFASASNGGAYSAGVGGAYGRLAAWTSLGALIGAPAGAPASEIDALAKRCAFLSYGPPGDWFYDVAWDVGALALRADGRSVAVLAATDTD